MILVDTALKAREMEGRPIRVALLGAGFMSRGLANHIVNTTPGMRLVGVYNRTVQRALDLCEYAGRATRCRRRPRTRPTPRSAAATSQRQTTPICSRAPPRWTCWWT